MDIVAILSTVILLTTAGTIMVAIAAYVAFKLRERRKPGQQKFQADGMRPGGAPIFLTRYLPSEAVKSGPSANRGTVSKP
ncbi:MAG: hypothetical protein ACOVO0_06280 [Burkholderiaceae bacterium]|jgi:hypothetical protein